MCSKEAEPQAVMARGSVRPVPDTDPGEQRWLPRGWRENQNRALNPKLLGTAGARATLTGLGRVQKSWL